LIFYKKYDIIFIEKLKEIKVVLIKDLKERFTETSFGYIVYPTKEICIEIEDIEKARIYAKIFGGVFYDHFPYEEYGFEDPYAFCNTWTITNQDDDIIEYEVTEEGVKEVLISAV